MLIRNAEIWRQGHADLRIAHGRIVALGTLDPGDDEHVIDAAGAALLPGLHDHHIHLAAEAARRQSVPCGPPDVVTEDDLARALAKPGEGWLRGTNYHESVAGLLTCEQLDSMQPDRPVRIQDRTGRMWFFNSPAIAQLLEHAEPPPGFDRETCRLFDGDTWLRIALRSSPPDLAALTADLAATGLTGVTDMSPANAPAMARHFGQQMESGALPQTLVLAGTPELAERPAGARWLLGPGKLHLHDAALPDPAEAAHFIRAVHRQGRAIAIHCVTEAELVIALAAIAEAGAKPGDRIEHGGIAPDHLLAEMARLGLQLCSNPAFIAARGDRYLADVEPGLQPFLYRLAAARDAGIVLAGGSDAPYGPTDPWLAMRAAVNRETATGAVIGAAEALSPEEALSLYLSDPLDLARERQVALGGVADLVLLDRPWREARDRLLADDVRCVLAGGSIVHERVD